MASTARLDELKKKFDENPRRYFAPLANEHRKSGDLDQAISLCRAHLPQQPAHISGHIVLAQALFEAGSVDESRDIFLAALGLDPENLIALRYLGDIARDADDVETARSWYQRVLEVDPRNDEIVQLVRDLDAPSPAVVESTAAAEPETAGPVAPPPMPAATPSPAAEDPRYAPLSMESFDIGEPEPDATEVSATSDAAVPVPDADAFDVPNAWDSAAPAVDVSMLETQEIDPFDLHPSASAESLFDAGADASAEDFFLTELSGLNAPGDTDEQAVPHDDPERATAPAPLEATSAEVESASFEEGAFYIDEATTAPAEANATASADVAAVQDVTPIAASTAAVVHQPPETGDAFVESSAEASVGDPNAEALALFADSQTAEWQPPAAPVNETLGLEVMEFVPPSSEFASAVNEVSSGEPGPAAFVTETMAELYLQQGFRTEALAVYRELLSRNPTDASLRDRIEQIESGSMSSVGMAMLSESVVDSALKRQTGKPSRSVRSFFASLAGRRVPVGEQTDSDEPSSDASVADQSVEATHEMLASEPVPVTELAPRAPMPRVTPSAAEALATFDPFADTMEAPEPATPNVMPDQAPSALPDLDYVAATLAATAPDAEHMPAHRSLEDLFPDTPVPARAEAAAQTFATAFGRDEPQGRPTRAASNELSLDHVFRGAPETEGAPPADGGFSFDQFFSDSRPAGGDVATAPTTISTSNAGRGGPANDTNDIEQFTAWLEGLKKK